jgi:potassium efflux system protein
MAIIGNVAWLFYLCDILMQNVSILINLALVGLFFKILLNAARLCLVETVHKRAGPDVRLYHRLRWSFIVGGIVTALTVFIHQLPLIYEVKDLFDRLFLLCLLTVSVFLLKSWDVLPGLILPHIDERHTYVKRVVRLLCLLIPVILLINSLIGLCGFVNFVQTISWYESVFLLVLVGYLFLRGLSGDVTHFFSQVMIRHVANGWLWTEAFLKPIDRVLRIVLFLSAWATLFHFYGWDRQSPVVINLIKLLNYQLISVFNTVITPLSILELVVTISMLTWTARWTREFVYRFLLSRTKDLGVRNSIAILSQYLAILAGIFICLRVLGIDFRALAYVAGAFAFGVGLGLRDLVNNFACGFLLLIERPLRVGDTVTINGHEGEVIHIGGRAVTVRTWDHMDVLVPNAEIFSKSFVNWTAKDNIIRTVIAIKINRHDKPQDVQSVIYQVLAEHKDVLSEPSPEVFLKELNDGLIEFEVRYYINLRLVKSRIGIRSEVLVAIWGAFEKHGIQPPYPHHEIHLKNDSGLPVLSKMMVE